MYHLFYPTHPFDLFTDSLVCLCILDFFPFLLFIIGIYIGFMWEVKRVRHVYKVSQYNVSRNDNHGRSVDEGGSYFGVWLFLVFFFYCSKTRWESKLSVTYFMFLYYLNYWSFTCSLIRVSSRILVKRKKISYHIDENDRDWMTLSLSIDSATVLIKVSLVVFLFQGGN